MPYISSSIRLSQEQDRRIKLTETQKEEIYYKYHFQNDDNIHSWNSLAEEYNVSKKTIGNIVNKEMGNKSKEYSKEYMKTYTQSSEQWNEHMKNHRKYKQTLYLKGELK